MAKYCTNCGAENPSSANFCSYCGSALQAGTQPNDSQNTYSYQNTTTQNTNSTAKTAATIAGAAIGASLLSSLFRRRRPFIRPMVSPFRRDFGPRPMGGPRRGPGGPGRGHGPGGMR